LSNKMTISIEMIIQAGCVKSSKKDNIKELDLQTPSKAGRQRSAHV